MKSELIDSSYETPCLGMMINLDPNIISELLKNFDELKEWQIEKRNKQIITTFPMNKDIKINKIAKISSMSVPSLHKNFKKATSLSPIQFIKHLRLHNAHSLLLQCK